MLPVVSPSLCLWGGGLRTVHGNAYSVWQITIYHAYSIGECLLACVLACAYWRMPIAGHAYCGVHAYQLAYTQANQLSNMYACWHR